MRKYFASFEIVDYVADFNEKILNVADFNEKIIIIDNRQFQMKQLYTCIEQV